MRRERTLLALRRLMRFKAARAMARQLTKDEAAGPASDLGPPVVRHVSIYHLRTRL